MKKVLFLICLSLTLFSANSQTLTILEVEVAPENDSPYAGMTILVDRYFKRANPVNGQWGIFGYARGDFNWATVMIGVSRQFYIGKDFLITHAGLGFETANRFRYIAGAHAKLYSGTHYAIVSSLIEFSSHDFWYRAQISKYFGMIHLGLFGQRHTSNGPYMSVQVNHNLDIWCSVGHDFEDHNNPKRIVNAVIVGTRLVFD